MGSKFRVFQDSINKTSEPLTSPLPEDMASCFNATYHKTSLAETSEMKDLLTTTLHPSNIDMVVRTTNNGLFSLKDPAVPNIRSRDAKLQEAEIPICYHEVGRGIGSGSLKRRSVPPIMMYCPTVVFIL